MEIFTKENILKTRNDPEMLDKVAKTMQMTVLMLYFSSESHEDAPTSAEEEDAVPDGILCSLCGEITMYSADALLPGHGLDKMCISLSCIKKTVLTLANTYAETAPSSLIWSLFSLVILILKLILLLKLLAV